MKQIETYRSLFLLGLSSVLVADFRTFYNGFLEMFTIILAYKKIRLCELCFRFISRRFLVDFRTVSDGSNNHSGLHFLEFVAEHKYL